LRNTLSDSITTWCRPSTPYDEAFEPPADGDHEHEQSGGEDEFDVHEDLVETFTDTFDEVGTYLYFPVPHGTPFSFEDTHLPEEGRNLSGQRGAVSVHED
jgi:hypothetical protein